MMHIKQKHIQHESLDYQRSQTKQAENTHHKCETVFFLKYDSLYPYADIKGSCNYRCREKT